MRLKDVEKKERIRQSTLDVIYEEGISNFSFSKVCEKAKVSSGTPYVYYEDKTDMLSQLYNDCYNIIFKDIENCIKKGKTIEEDIYNTIYYHLNQLIKHPKECYYIESIWTNMELVDESKLINKKKAPQEVREIYENAVKEDVLITTDPLTIIALAYRPGIFYIARHQNDIKIEDMEDIIRASIDSILK